MWETMKEVVREAVRLAFTPRTELLRRPSPPTPEERRRTLRMLWGMMVAVIGLAGFCAYSMYFWGWR